MADIKPIGKALFLREEELRRGIEMMFFAYRDFTGEADSILAEQDMGRAHHRAIYFIGRHPGITVSDLLSILNITKQSLSRVLSGLMKDGFVLQKPGASDRRQRLLYLTETGIALLSCDKSGGVGTPGSFLGQQFNLASKKMVYQHQKTVDRH